MLEALPLYAYQVDVWRFLKDPTEQVAMITGATGCGKTLLLPQLVYEYYTRDIDPIPFRRIYVVVRNSIDKRYMASRCANQFDSAAGIQRPE